MKLMKCVINYKQNTVFSNNREGCFNHDYDIGYKNIAF